MVPGREKIVQEREKMAQEQEKMVQEQTKVMEEQIICVFPPWNKFLWVQKGVTSYPGQGLGRGRNVVDDPFGVVEVFMQGEEDDAGWGVRVGQLEAPESGWGIG